MHCILKGPRFSGCPVKPLICLLSSKSFHGVSRGGCWQDRDWNAFFKDTVTRGPGYRLLAHSFLIPAFGWDQGWQGLVCVSSLCLGSQRPLLTVEGEGKTEFLNLVPNKGLSSNRPSGFPL